MKNIIGEKMNWESKMNWKKIADSIYVVYKLNFTFHVNVVPFEISDDSNFYKDNNLTLNNVDVAPLLHYFKTA